jgi:hypothetical protein
MNTKLTLRLEESLIAQAKAYAAKEGRSLSDLVASYFVRLSADNAVASIGQKPAKSFSKTDKLVGALAGAKLDESDYKTHLISKYK